MTRRVTYLGKVDFPDEWITDEWLFGEVIATAEVTAGTAVLAGGMLADGSNLFGLLYPGGQRLMRTSAATNWALEERFTGEPPDRIGMTLWRAAVDELAAAIAAARAARDDAS